jgi:tetratricopeptide (TPR) repeat protein
MRSADHPIGFLTAALGLLFICVMQLALRFHDPYPSMVASLTTPETGLQDVGGIALGLRRLAADIAWIQTLQYYGTPEAGQSESEFENGMGKYPRFLAHCERVIGIDPYFTYVYYYGGGVLGWNLERYSEAEHLIKEGIARNPAEWRLPQYLAGLAYQKNHDITQLTTFLESLVQDPNCPLMMKALLANVYKKQRLYDKALELWSAIYDARDPAYMQRALDQSAHILRLKRAKT